jgi:hypothetical protein
MRTSRQSVSFKRSLQVIAANLLLLIFLLPSFVEALHHHSRPKANIELTGYPKKSGRPQFDTYSFCKICDYLQHASHHYTADQPALHPVFLPIITLKTKTAEHRIIPALILTYANKGPPAV